MKNVTIIIPSWNGKEILKKSLPAVLKYAMHSPIIVVDDGSSDDTEEFLKKFNEVRVIKNASNQGFTKSVNRALREVETEYVCLLNNDVYPQKGFLDKALTLMSEDIVAVTFNEENSSWPNVAWKDGKLSFTQGDKDEYNHYCMWPSGGSCLIKTESFVELGGFREVFSPGYFEDIELGFRIWRSGKRVVWAKDATVIHKHETSFKRLDPGFVADLKQSNELVFTWLTFCEGGYFVDHLLFLITYSISHPGYIRIIFMALRKFLTVTKQPSPKVVPIAQVLKTANQRYD